MWIGWTGGSWEIGRPMYFAAMLETLSSFFIIIENERIIRVNFFEMNSYVCVFVYLFFELGVFHAKLLLVEVRIFVDRRTAARRANDVLQSLSDGDVLASDLVVLRSQRAIVCSFMLCLFQKKQKINK